MSTDKLLHGDLTYQIRGAMFTVHKALGPGHKEMVYQKALAKELTLRDIPFVAEKVLDVTYMHRIQSAACNAAHYKDEKVGIYRPDFVIDDKVIVEIKAVPFLAKNAEVQLSYYLRGTSYELGLLVNFGARKLDIRRRIYSLQR